MDVVVGDLFNVVYIWKAQLSHLNASHGVGNIAAVDLYVICDHPDGTVVEIPVPGVIACRIRRAGDRAVKYLEVVAAS